MPVPNKKGSIKTVVAGVLGKVWGWVDLARFSRFVSWPLPKGWWSQIMVLFVLAALPFLPLQLIPLEPAHLWIWPFAAIFVVLAAYSFVERVFTSLVIAKEAKSAILDKLVGARPAASDRLAILHKSPWRGFAQLVLTVLTVGCVVVISTASISYSLINHFGFRSPFGVPPEVGTTLWYFVDEATRGMTARFFDAIHLTKPQKLEIDGDARLSSWLGGGVWLYHGIVFALTAQVGWLLWTFVRAKTDRRVRDLHDRLSELKEELRRRKWDQRDAEWDGKWQTIRHDADRSGGPLNKNQRRALERRLDELNERRMYPSYYERSQKYEQEKRQIDGFLGRDKGLQRQDTKPGKLSK